MTRRNVPFGGTPEPRPESFLKWARKGWTFCTMEQLLHCNQQFMLTLNSELLYVSTKSSGLAFVLAR
jgi:hypothetical protein